VVTTDRRPLLKLIWSKFSLKPNMEEERQELTPADPEVVNKYKTAGDIANSESSIPIPSKAPCLK
jgi:hypothetical protein